MYGLLKYYIHLYIYLLIGYSIETLHTLHNHTQSHISSAPRHRFTMLAAEQRKIAIDCDFWGNPQQQLV